MATINDVARLAGVSGATVSHVINNTRKVNPETHIRVEKAILALDYHPNATARGLKTGYSKLIGVMSISSIDPFFSEIMFGLEHEAAASGYGLLLQNSEFDQGVQMDNLQMLLEKNIDGLIVNSPIMTADFMAATRKAKFPILFLQYYDEELPFDFIHTDDFQASYEAACHLIELGHKRIACIAGFTYPQHSVFNRRAGYEQALKDNNLPVDKTLIGNTQYAMQEGYDVFNKMRALKKPPTAFLTYSDLLALGAARAAADQGLEIPRDVSIVGFDDIEIAAFTVPRLTTIRQEKALMGRLAFERIQARIADPSLPTERHILPARLVVRESSGPAPS
ncbi:MAG: LacI family DNA-binding transcriptional regulator [Anaerolineaceae bacterium]